MRQFQEFPLVAQVIRNQALGAEGVFARQTEVSLVDLVNLASRVLLQFNVFDHLFHKSSPNVGVFSLLSSALGAFFTFQFFDAELTENSTALRAHLDF